MRYHPGNYATSQEPYPLQDGDIQPINRAQAISHFLTQPHTYPHCQICHRAMLARADGQFTCPNGCMSIAADRPLTWWQRLVRVFRPTPQPTS